MSTRKPKRDISTIQVPMPDGTITTWKAACTDYELKLGNIALSLSEMLMKFPTIDIELCMVGESYMIANMSVADSKVIHALLNAFYCGAKKWGVTIANCPISKPNENRVEFHASLPLKGFRNIDAIKREVDYKICLLKNQLWSLNV